MEELLNKLIEKGWKPFGALWKARNSVYTNNYFFFEWCADGVTLRQLTSKESWLWQFVCKNELVIDEHYCWDWYIHWDDNWRIEIWQNDYRYRLIESALCNEEDLEKFLLENIKVS